MDRINRVLAEPTEFHPDPVAGESTGLTPGGSGVVEPVVVEFDAVGFSYPSGPPVLSDLDLRLDPGETVALVGATGSGKSTAVALLAGLVPPTVGEVRVGGVATSALGPEGVARTVATVLQETFLFADSVRANLALGIEVDDDELARALAAASADRFVAELPAGLDTVVGERGITLSGGQRQRLAIARALLRQPAVLVLDDATSAVDPVVEAGILESLRRPVGGDTVGGRSVGFDSPPTLLVIAHRMATIRLADRVLFLEGGRIAASGIHDELLEVEAYAALAQAYEKAGGPR